MRRKQIILITSCGVMAKGKLDIKKIPLNSRKITDTNESQITRNFWVLIWKPKTVRPLHNAHQCRELVHTYMCMSLSVCV